MNKDYQKFTEDREKLIQYIIGCIDRNEFRFIKESMSDYFYFETADGIPFSVNINWSNQSHVVFFGEWSEFKHENINNFIKERKKKELLKQLEQL